MEINEYKLYDELLEVRRKIMRDQSINNIKKYKPVFDQLNYTLQQITGYAVDPDDMFYRNMDTLNENIRLYNKKQLLEYFSRALSEGDSLYFLYMSFNDILKESNYIKMFNDNIPTYTEEQAREMILKYFEQFGSKIYNIAKIYLDERVSIDVDLSPGIGGSFMNNYSNEFGYILMKYDIFNAASISGIVHEIGHAIDNSLFVYPQQKELSVSNQFLVEVPSTFFEINLRAILSQHGVYLLLGPRARLVEVLIGGTLAALQEAALAVGHEDIAHNLYALAHEDLLDGVGGGVGALGRSGEQRHMHYALGIHGADESLHHLVDLAARFLAAQEHERNGLGHIRRRQRLFGLRGFTRYRFGNGFCTALGAGIMYTSFHQ